MEFTIINMLAIVVILVGLLYIVDYVGEFLAVLAIFYHEKKERKKR